MRAKHIAVALTGLFVGLVAVQPSGARVVKLVVEQRTPFVAGADWGKAGPYEMLRGTAYLEADPNNPHDAVIVDASSSRTYARCPSGWNAMCRGPEPEATGANGTVFGLNRPVPRLRFSALTLSAPRSTPNT